MSDKRKYRKFTPKQKVELVLASFRGDRSVAEICREHDLSEALLRRWRDQMIEAGAERYQDGQDGSEQAEQRRRIAELEALGKKTYELELSGKLLRDWEYGCASPGPASSSLRATRPRWWRALRRSAARRSSASGLFS